MKPVPFILSLFVGATAALAQLNEDIRKKMEANQPLHEVIQQAEAAAMEIGKSDGSLAPAPKKLKDISTSEDLNAALSGIVATWATAGIDVGNVGGELQVTKVAPDSPAAKAGLQVGDHLQSVDGNKVKGVGDFLLSVGAKFDGTIAVDILRGSAPKSLKLDLGKPDPKKTKSEWNFKAKPTGEDKKSDATSNGKKSE